MNEYNINNSGVPFNKETTMEYLTTTEVSKLWKISPRRVRVLCKEGRVSGAVNKGIWLIPADSKKPEDPRKEKGKN